MAKNLELFLKRFKFTENATYGRLHIGGEFFCYILEDTDRRLEDGGEKIYGKTAIPRGRYEIIINHSPRFGRQLPLLLNVPGFEGIRIHTGNKPEDTLGCLIPGLKIQPEKNWIANSRAAFDPLMGKIHSTLVNGGKVFIEVT